MKTKLMVRILITGLALLAGFQFWLLTGSVLVGALVGAVAWIFLVWFIKGLDRRVEKRRRLIGEVREKIDEEDFVNLVKTDEMVRERVQEKVKKQPQHVAGSIRTLLVKDKPGQKK